MTGLRMRFRRDGFTLTEVLVAMTLFAGLITVTLSVFNQQVRTFSSSSLQVDATQNLRYTMSVFEKDLPTTGANLAPDQPFLVYADTHVVVVNADYMSNVPNDLFAVYVDTLQPDSMVTALTKLQKFTLPLTTFQYPDTTYRLAGQNSPGETLIFLFQPDGSTARTDDYQLFRQVNRMAPELIARNVLKSANRPFFKYHRRIEQTTGLSNLDSIPTAWKPLRHTIPVHGAVADTGVAGRIDQVRAIEVRFRTSDMGPPGRERLYETRRIIALPNAGRRAAQTCGDAPLLGTVNFTATVDVSVPGAPAVNLSWAPAIDQTAGEKDVVRYILYRSTSPLTGNEDPFLSIPSGSTTYAFTDNSVTNGNNYYYALAAQDCTPRLSSTATKTVYVP